MNCRKFFIVAMILGASILTACGGGGGGDSSTPPAPTPPAPVASVAITQSSLSPAEGGNVATNTELMVAFTFANSAFQSASRTTLSCGAVGQPKQVVAYTLKALATPTVSVTIVPTGGLTFGHACTLVWLIDGTGNANATATVNFTVSNLKYTDKVIAIKDGGAPFMVTKTGAVKVVNKTQYQAGFIPLGICELGSPQLTDGKVLTRCTNAVATASTPANSRVVLYVNPVTGEQFDYTGTVPANIIWKSVENNSDKPEWSAKARVSDGWFFTPFNATTNLRFQADTGVITNIQSGGDPFNVMITYTN